MTKDKKDNYDNETGGFSIEMSKTGVSPLKNRQHKVMLRPPKQNLNLPVLRHTAAAETLHENDPDHYGGTEWLGPHDIVEYRKDGIQHAVFKNLKQGRYDIGADLDLHSYRVEDARAALFEFVKDCMDHDIRCAIVIHGKGWHGQQEKSDESETGKGRSVSRIKSYTVQWLKAMNAVTAFSSAQPRDGGTGALYVLFKKSDKAKEENRRHYRPEA